MKMCRIVNDSTNDFGYFGEFRTKIALWGWLCEHERSSDWCLGWKFVTCPSNVGVDTVDICGRK